MNLDSAGQDVLIRYVTYPHLDRGRDRPDALFVSQRSPATMALIGAGGFKEFPPSITFEWLTGLGVDPKELGSDDYIARGTPSIYLVKQVPMKKLYGICFMAVLANVFLSLSITGIIPIYSGALHQSAVPHLMLTFIALAVLIVHYKGQTFFTLMLAVATIIGSLGTYWWALKGWPGGDDGPGLAWAYVIGPISIFESFVCVPILFYLYYHGLGKNKRF